MKQRKKQTPRVQSGTMTTQKTNEDFNRQKPDPEDPNQKDQGVPAAEDGLSEKTDVTKPA
jgi:hypothetical protein